MNEARLRQEFDWLGEEKGMQTYGEEGLRDELRNTRERLMLHYACSCSLAFLVDTIVNSRWTPKPTDATVKQAMDRLREVAETEGDPFFDTFARG